MFVVATVGRRSPSPTVRGLGAWRTLRRAQRTTDRREPARGHPRDRAAPSERIARAGDNAASLDRAVCGSRSRSRAAVLTAAARGCCAAAPGARVAAAGSPHRELIEAAQAGNKLRRANVSNYILVYINYMRGQYQMSTTEQKAARSRRARGRRTRPFLGRASRSSYMGVCARSAAPSRTSRPRSPTACSPARPRSRRLETKDENLHAPPAVARTSSTPSATPRSVVSTAVSAEGDEVEFEGRSRSRASRSRRRSPGTIIGPIADPLRQRALRAQARDDDRPDRSSASPGTRPMPDGSNALADEVTLKADLSLVAAE